MPPSSDVASSTIVADRVCQGSSPAADPPRPRLLDRVRAAVHNRHYSILTQKAYVGSRAPGRSFAILTISDVDRRAVR